VKITVPLLAQVYSIVSKRVDAMNTVFTLQEYAAFVVFKMCPSEHEIKQTGLPQTIVKAIIDIHPFLSNIIEYDMSKEGGYSALRPAKCARFLQRHLNKFIGLDIRRFVLNASD
jgi:hypothetical protein